MFEDDLIQDALNKGLINFARMPTEPMPTAIDWWNCRAWVMATDKDRQAAELSLPEGLRLRLN